jgi:hypothetical protein
VLLEQDGAANRIASGGIHVAPMQEIADHPGVNLGAPVVKLRFRLLETLAAGGYGGIVRGSTGLAIPLSIRGRIIPSHRTPSVIFP